MKNLKNVLLAVVAVIGVVVLMNGVKNLANDYVENKICEEVIEMAITELEDVGYVVVDTQVKDRYIIYRDSYDYYYMDIDTGVVSTISNETFNKILLARIGEA